MNYLLIRRDEQIVRRAPKDQEGMRSDSKTNICPSLSLPRISFHDTVLIVVLILWSHGPLE